MNYGIGIDTGGTYTDIVLYDYDKKAIIKKGKTLTTKEDLCVGITNALDLIPSDLLKQAKMLSLSTTLATNACVEHKGSRAKLILIGTSKKVLEWIDAKNTYGLDYDDVLCLDIEGSFDGRIVNHPDWDEVIKENLDWFAEAQALAVAEVNALHNGAVCEKLAHEKITREFDVPFITANEFAQNLNMMERGATALLNARLLPVIEEFMVSVKRALSQKNIDIKTMIVRSDGSLMTDIAAHTKPVKTILSGPAASVIGAISLKDEEHSLIVDIGGTTTDISIVENNRPIMTDSIKIGGWRTQISGVFIDTFGLGGDSRIYAEETTLTLGSRRVQPLCVLADKYPQISKEISDLIALERVSYAPLHEFIYLVREPSSLSSYSEYEREIIEMLKDGPVMLGSNRIDYYNMRVVRLENEGIIMRAGMTPTDIMHIKGDFKAHNNEASVLGARYLLRMLSGYEDTDEDLRRFCDDVYEMVSEKLYVNLVRVMLSHQHKDIFTKTPDEQVMKLVYNAWKNRFDTGHKLLDLKLSTPAKLIGIGAPTHIFLPEVAKALECECVIPEHAEVANALGAIVADITGNAKITVSPCYPGSELVGYKVYSDKGLEVFEEHETAIEHAKKLAEEQAVAEAKNLGAIGEITVEIVVDYKNSISQDGVSVELGDIITATASGHIN